MAPHFPFAFIQLNSIEEVDTSIFKYQVLVPDPNKCWVNLTIWLDDLGYDSYRRVISNCNYMLYFKDKDIEIECKLRFG